MHSQPCHVVLIQGSWHAPVHAKPLLKAFIIQEIACEDIQHPSKRVLSGTLLPPTINGAETALYLQLHVDLSAAGNPEGKIKAVRIDSRLPSLVKHEQRPVLIIAHSWSAVPLAEAMAHKASSLPLSARKLRARKAASLLYYSPLRCECLLDTARCPTTLSISRLSLRTRLSRSSRLRVWRRLLILRNCYLAQRSVHSSPSW